MRLKNEIGPKEVVIMISWKYSCSKSLKIQWFATIVADSPNAGSVEFRARQIPVTLR